MARPISKTATTELGRVIDAICARREWSLAGFARAAGLKGKHSSQVSRYRDGTTVPTPGRLKAWDARPELRDDAPALRAAVERDAARAKERADAEARAKALPASGKPPHIIEALAAVEAILTRSAPGSWIGGWIEHLELEARKHPLPYRANGTGSA